MTDELTLISQTLTKDTELQPELKFTVFFGDYENESVVEFQGNRYAVYRTYRAGDYMELYVERKIGA